MLAPGTRALPGTTGAVTLAGTGGIVNVLPSAPMRKALAGLVPLFPLHSGPPPGFSVGAIGARQSTLCPNPTDCKVSTAVCTPFKRS